MSTPAAPGSVGYGQQDPNDASSEFNRTLFAVRQRIERMETMKLVKVMAVTGGGGAIAAAGTVDVQPMVSQIDGGGNATPHGVVTGIPWWRLQGGGNAIIIDPEVGDYGYVVVSDRDTSVVRNSLAPGSPGSFRKFNIADGIYVGGCLNGPPTQFFAFTSSGVTMQDMSGNVVTFGASGVVINGLKIDRSGNLSTTGTITDGTGNLSAHVHSGVTTGASNTGPRVG